MRWIFGSTRLSSNRDGIDVWCTLQVVKLVRIYFFPGICTYMQCNIARFLVWYWMLKAVAAFEHTRCKSNDFQTIEFFSQMRAFWLEEGDARRSDVATGAPVPAVASNTHTSLISLQEYSHAAHVIPKISKLRLRHKPRQMRGTFGLIFFSKDVL